MKSFVFMTDLCKLSEMKFAVVFMANVILIIISDCTIICRAISEFEDLSMRLEKSPQLRHEFIKAFGRVSGNLLLSDKIDIRGSISEVLSNTVNYKVFGIELTVPEIIQLLIISFNEAPVPDKITFSKYFDSNGNLNALVKAAVLLKKILYQNKLKPTKDDLSLVVETTEGKVRGVNVNEKGVKYMGFFNIPYATVPRRFMAPRPPTPWKGIRSVEKEEIFCPQQLSVFGTIAGFEDCLQLNVMVPTPRSERTPVFMWVHGGQFNFGFANAHFFNPYKILGQKLIVVSIHYRIGALGFLSTGTKDAPGNAGMKDIVAALKWVKANIARFGGDPDNITLYGVSSGATAIEYLMLSPMAKGLFSRAILGSGSVFNEWSYVKEPLKNAFRLGRELGFNSTSTKNLIKFLRKANPLEIVEAQEKIAVADNPSGEFLPFVPCTEKKIPGVESFLSGHPEDIMRSGQYYQVPAIYMFNNQEGLQLMINLRTNPNYIFTIDRNLEYYLPYDILDGLDKPWQKDEILKRIRKFYFNNEKIGNKTIQSTVDLLSDTKFLLGVHKSVRIRTETTNIPTFYCELAHDGDLNIFKYYNNIGVSGVAHSDDVGYVLALPFERIYSQNDATTQLVSRRYVKMFANFAKYGHPIPMPTKLLPVKWHPIRGPGSYDYLLITHNLEMRKNPFQRRFQFWENLYEYKKYLLYKGSQYNYYKY